MEVEAGVQLQAREPQRSQAASRWGRGMHGGSPAHTWTPASRAGTGTPGCSRTYTSNRNWVPLLPKAGKWNEVYETVVRTLDLRW